MTKSYFLTITQYENVGDLVINKMLLEEISKYSEVYLDLGTYSNHFTDELKTPECIDVFAKKGLTLHSSHKMFSTLSFIKKTGVNHFFISPGPKSIKSILNSRILGLLFIFLWCKLCGIKVYYVGVDLRNTSKSNRIFNALLSVFLEKIYLRDNVLIKEINKPNVDYIPDVSLLLDKNVKTYKKEKLVLMSFREFDGVEHNENFETYLDSVIKYYLDNNYKVKFFFQVERDKNYNIYLYSKYSDNENVTLYNSLVWYKDIEKIYSSSSVVVSNRMHVLLIGLIYRSNIITMLGEQASTKKIFYVFKSLGISDSIYNINDRIFNGLKLEFSTDEITKLVHEQRSIIESTIKNIF